MKAKTEKVIEEKKLTKKEIAAADPMSLDGVDGLGPASIKALHAESIFTTKQLIQKNPVWLKDVTGNKLEECGLIFGTIKERLEKAGLIRKSMMTGTEALEYRKNVQKISTNCPSIDLLLDGGIECGSMTEVYGQDGSGKTELAHCLAIQAQLPVEKGGLAQEGKPPVVVFYLSTENTYRSERIISMLAGRGLISDYPKDLKHKIVEKKLLTLDEIQQKESVYNAMKKEAEKYLDKIQVVRLTDAMQQIDFVKGCISYVTQIPGVKLMILDSGTALFRSSFIGRGNIKSKFDALNEMCADLNNIAENNDIAIVFVNQIYQKPDIAYGSDGIYTTGGNIVGHAMPTQIHLSKSGQRYKCQLVKSPHLPQAETKYDIAEKGLIEVE